MKRDDCPNRAKHTRCPDGYLQWHAWAEKKSKTHHQVRCPGCNLFAIWVPGATVFEDGDQGQETPQRVAGMTVGP